MFIPNSYHAFISHASEDKESFVKHLAYRLTQKGCRVWYDEFCIDYGDFFSEKIYEGINNSQFGIIVITSTLTTKRSDSWVWKELNEFLKKETDLANRILIPILYNITIDDLRQYLKNQEDLNFNNISTLLKKRMMSTYKDGGIEGIVDKLKNIFDNNT